MEKRTWEQLGIQTSLLGFGCMRFPTNADGSINEAEAEKLIDTAIHQGVTYIDTAYPYYDGKSEPFVGRILQKYDRQAFTLATKLPLWQVQDLASVQRIFEEQIARLQVDYIDFYLLHALDKEKWEKVKVLGILDYLEAMREKGLIKYIGFSFHDEYEVFEEILTYRQWDFCQIQLNYMDIHHQQGIKGYELATKLHIPVVIMEPNKGGMLARLPKDIAKLFQNENPTASMASWAMRWIGSLPNVKVVLSGMSDESQVLDNLATFSTFHPFSIKEQAVVSNVKKAIDERTKVGCTACGYCMPCPHGVNIPKNFKVWNTYAMYEDKQVAMDATHALQKANAFASACMQCGLCEKQCPQHIAIRTKLQETKKCLESID